MIDRYLRGRVDRISPEAPVPVVHLQDEENRLGGAANVVLNIQALGATPLLASVIGLDAYGENFQQLLQKQELDNGGISASTERQTTVKTRVIAENQQLLRADREDTHYLSSTEASELLGLIEDIVTAKSVDLILFQDYNKGVLSASFIEAVLKMAQQKHILTAVDPKKANFWSYQGVDLFKPNLREIQQQVDFHIRPNLSDLDQADAVIRSHLNNRYTMITLAAYGVYINDGSKSAIYPTQRRQIADVSGAGDTVISVAACGLAGRPSFKRACDSSQPSGRSSY